MDFNNLSIHDIAGFTYDGGSHHVDCIHDMAVDEVGEGSEYDTIDTLRRWAEREGVDFDDPYSYDSDDFPKAFEHASIRDGEKCDTCDEYLDVDLQEHVNTGAHGGEYYLAYAENYGGMDFDTDDADSAYRGEDVEDLYDWYRYQRMTDFETPFLKDVAREPWKQDVRPLEWDDIEQYLSEMGFSLSVDEDTVDQSYTLVNGFVIDTTV